MPSVGVNGKRDNGQKVRAVVDGRITALEMMNAFIARDTKAETD